MRAYILLKAKPQLTRELMHDLQDEAAVIHANLIHGPYDCIIEVRGKDLTEINDVVLNIRALPGVRDTITCTVVQSWMRSD